VLDWGDERPTNRTDLSLAIAHGLEDVLEEMRATPKMGGGAQHED